MEMKAAPISVYAEMTPNPATMKFVANKLLVEEGKVLEFTDPSETTDSELAASIFNFPFVTNIFISSNFVTVTKNDIIEWEDVTMDLREYITDFLKSGKEIITSTAKYENDSAKDQSSNSSNSSILPANETEEKIFKILEDYVKPAVEQDGGAIEFKKFENGILTVILRGSCSGCPSSSVTLKNGILQLFKNMLPEVQDVVAEER
ncbi:MAG: NifU family protein [Flavobacteriales bacterium]|nr:NifU family protein [Flavobacteriales bacterium]